MTRNLGPALMAEGGMVDEQVKADLVKKANTLEELADMLGFTGESRKIFLATIKRYNELYDAQEDQDFGKSAYRLSAIRKAPFYGLWLGGSLLTTIDGLSINADMQVLNKAKEPIIGLYATGDCSGSLFADNYPELMPGMAVGRTMTFALHIINKLKADGVTTGLTGNGVAKTSAESSVASAQNCKDGTYTASSPGIGGDVKVTVTIKSGKIVECTVDAAAETPTLGGAAAPQLAEKIISANGTNGVDAVSGSTITSQAVIKAVQKCLVQAAG